MKRLGELAEQLLWMCGDAEARGTRGCVEVRLERRWAGGGARAGARSRTRRGDRAALTSPTPISDDRDYSLFGELSAYTATGAQENLLQVTYERDTLGRITRKTESIEGGAAAEIFYKYDLAGRLWRVCVDAACTTVQSEYLYDANGNRIAGSFDTHSGTVVSASYDDQDRLASYETTLGGAASFAYGANGERERKTVGSDVTRYSYDALGNLKDVVLHEAAPNEQSITYLVDGKNRRIGRQVNGTVVQGFLYDGQWRIVAELDGAGNLVSRFVYGEKPNVPEYLVRGGVAYRILTDHLGSPRLVVKAADGTIAQRMDYDAFGNVLVDTNPGFQPFGFAGGLYDPDTGLARFGARDYDPQTGRWTAKDPIRFDGGDSNLYAYVLGDPVNFNDATGLATIDSFLACLQSRTRSNLHETNAFFLHGPTRLSRTALALITSGAVARTTGFTSLGMAVGGPTGNLAGVGLLMSLAANSAVNSGASLMALEVGILLGSEANALGQCLAEIPCGQ